MPSLARLVLGPVGDGPFQPRVRYGRTVLAPARWVLPARRPSCASSLIHMHTNRILGGTSTEPLVRALAADLLALPT